MCPDRQILSVYVDEELPSPWKEKMAAHLAGCAACRTCLDQYRQVSLYLNTTAGPPPDEDAARERVWGRLQAWRYGRKAAPLWSRSITLPLPAAAVAAALLAVSLGFAWFGRDQRGTPGLPEPSLANAGIDLDSQGMLPAADIDGILQYLGREEAGDIMVIRLPESKSFTSFGEPAVIRAADYSRRRQSP